MSLCLDARYTRNRYELRIGNNGLVNDVSATCVLGFLAHDALKI
jgi:hypothetical protein